jgi:hypothetical protein
VWGVQFTGTGLCLELIEQVWGVQLTGTGLCLELDTVEQVWGLQLTTHLQLVSSLKR